MLATLVALCLVAGQDPPERERLPTLHQSLELISGRLPYVDVNTSLAHAQFHRVNLQKARFSFGTDEIMAFRFDAVPDSNLRTMALGWHLPGVKRWGIWSRRGPEEQLEQFEEAKTGAGLFLGMGEPGQLVGSREYVMWFRVKEGSDANILYSLNMYSDWQMRLSALSGLFEGSVAQVHTTLEDADETEPWDAALTLQASLPPGTKVQPLPSPEESHLVFDSEAADSFNWDQFEYMGGRYASLTVDLGKRLMDDNLEMCAFGGEYDTWGYDTRAVVPMGTYSWGVKGSARIPHRLEGEPVLAADILAVRALVPPRGQKYSGSVVIWFKLTGDRPPRRVLLFYQDPSWRVRNLVGKLPVVKPARG